MNTQKTFRLDGREIPFEQGDTVMDAALKAGEYIPHLCHNPEFPAARQLPGLRGRCQWQTPVLMHPARR